MCSSDCSSMPRNSVRWAFNVRAWQPTREQWLYALRCVQPEEKERIQKFVFTKDAKASMIGRLLLRKCISELRHVPYHDIHLGRNEHNRPVLTHPQLAVRSFDFNVSHQGDFAVLAADDYPNVGVDVMKTEYSGGKTIQEFFAVMKRQFTPKEWSFVEQPGTESDLLRRFYRLWCLKESFVKATGAGLSIDLQRLNFNCLTKELKQGTITSNTKLYFDDQLLSDWIFQETMLDHDHCVCTALNVGNETTSPDCKLFTVLSFDELTSGSHPLGSSNDFDWTQFTEKSEFPS
ncbi:L-aminoadipate-semialdehyde dehydrogenase-phosphopantetheinyl transferase-like [Dermacentor silvarum]|uniref:L-aminoadipate-semialdehyde dehydrogenase-phosphopantetheinyl transferase-like n=1 Tax=Dermacentor silvarum TaxID=543639 RepID=UPI00189AD235|nr:L-aminoadipate-semialdehyde dehydrogenase-phosphopantetheinyl transferase-like [Dermacentor silvarum]